MDFSFRKDTVRKSGDGALIYTFLYYSTFKKNSMSRIVHLVAEQCRQFVQKFRNEMKNLLQSDALFYFHILYYQREVWERSWLRLSYNYISKRLYVHFMSTNYITNVHYSSQSVRVHNSVVLFRAISTSEIDKMDKRWTNNLCLCLCRSPSIGEQTTARRCGVRRAGNDLIARQTFLYCSSLVDLHS